MSTPTALGQTYSSEAKTVPICDTAGRAGDHCALKRLRSSICCLNASLNSSLDDACSIRACIDVAEGFAQVKSGVQHTVTPLPT